MKTLQSITTTLLTLVLLVAGTLGFAPQAAACPPGQCEFALYTDERPSGTDGDTLTPNTWNVRTINTTVIEQGSSISRSGNEITLQPGTYYIHAIPMVHYANTNKVRLRTTDNQTLAVSHTYYTHAAKGSELLTYIAVPSSMTFRIEHYTTYPHGGTRGGLGLSVGEPEVHLTIRIVKITDDKCH